VRARLDSYVRALITTKGFAMPIMYVLGGVVSLGLLVYLFVALLKPEALS